MQSKSRSYSLDILRILCMLMIVSLHFLSHGGMLEYFSESEIPYYIMNILRALCICSVNVFVLISGYFMVEKNKINIKRIVSIAISILFYSWIYLGLNLAFNFTELDLKGFLTAIFPISYKLYWFPTCYLFICIISPFLNDTTDGVVLPPSALAITCGSPPS